LSNISITQEGGKILAFCALKSFEFLQIDGHKNPVRFMLQFSGLIEKRGTTTMKNGKQNLVL